jgi:hypothetical protein
MDELTADPQSQIHLNSASPTTTAHQLELELELELILSQMAQKPMLRG